ncbi:MAG: hypothetical protein OEW19_11135, partial [Acidobacteriota bacterium]|nr:hypothetical protein [Acidobacteriota bacterium]
VLLHRFWTEGDALERAAMGLLALVTAGALLFAWWNWHGMLRAPGESTVTYLELAIERARRFTRAARGGWAVLGLQVAVFTPWVAQRLYGGGRVPAPGAQLFAWGLLVGMTAVAAVGLVALGRWSAREARALDDLRAELRDQG